MDSSGKSFHANCNYCNQRYVWHKGGGYGTLIKHLQKKHPSYVGIESAQTQLNFQGGASGTGTAASTTGGESCGVNSIVDSFGNLFHFNEQTYREELAKFVCSQHLPFNVANSNRYQNFVSRGLNPAARKVSRQTVTRDIDKIVLKWKNELIEIFRNLDTKVSICSDIWSDHWQEHSYMGITCHWIDRSWTLQKRLIAYKEFDTQHTARNIYYKIRSILEDYGLSQKVFSIGFDNASANTKSIDELKAFCQPSIGGKFFHIRCICHIINLCVQIFLTYLRSSVTPIRKAVSYLSRHSMCLKKWRKFCKENGFEPKKFSADVPTRWNSTYNMLRNTFPYKDLLCDFFANKFPEAGITLDHSDWSTCSTYTDILRLFEKATKNLSGVYYPTSHCVLPNCVAIAISFNECFKRTNYLDELLKEALTETRNHWLKYFFHIPPIFLIAFLLDPRFKFEGLTEQLRLYYMNLFADTFDDVQEYRSIIPNHEGVAIMARTYLYEIFNEMKSAQEGGTTERTETTSSSSFSRGREKSPILGEGLFSQSSDLSSFFNMMDSRSKRPRNDNQSYELDSYLNSIFYGYNESGDFDIFNWWSRRASIYPTVALIAREVFACPASTVAVEQAFSIGGLTLTQRRSRLTVEHVENQCLLDDWVRAVDRTQDAQQSTDSSEDFPTETESEAE